MMHARTLPRSLLVLLCLVLAACQQGADPNAEAEIANPAAVYCVDEKAGTSEIRTDEDGGQYGVCILPDGTEVEEWELYRQDHPEGE